MERFSKRYSVPSASVYKEAATMAETANIRPAVYQSLPIDNIRPAAHQARKTFDEDSIKALAESIHQEGLIEPIIVRQVGDGYELISGERRLRASKLLGLKTIE